MKRIKTVLIILLAGVASAAAAAETADQRSQREGQNVAVMMKHYPSASLAAGEQGRVFFSLSLDRDGVPTGCVVTRGSGFTRLDDATCDLVLRYAIFQPIHNERGGKVAMTSDGALIWSIPGRARIEPTATMIIQSDPLDRLICRRQIMVGSLVRYERTCMTLREWNAQSAEMKQPWKDAQSKGFSIDH